MKYQDLVFKVIEHNKRYYDNSAPTISDIEYDKLYDKLDRVEKAQGWAAYNSPTLRVGGSPGKIEHPFQLYSLKKVYDKEEIGSEFDIVTPKIDGTNLTLLYHNKLVRAITRGDGKFGEDVTHLAREISNIPQNVDMFLAVTGECVTDNNVDNFRNYVSGAIGLKNIREFKTRNIKFIAHDELQLKNRMNYTTRMDILKNMGFNTVLQEKFCAKYPQDGLVYRIDSAKECEKLGYTSKYPRFAVALKPREQVTATTILQDVKWQIGRTGVVTPVGIVDPVILDDATITRVTLHNMSFVEYHMLGLGDQIEIERAGGVIPKMLRVLQPSEHARISEEDASRFLNCEVKRDGPRLCVSNPEEHGTVKLLHHFIARMGIKGLGPKSVEKLGLTHPVDLYQSQPWHLLGANGAKIKDEIERSKTKPYHVVLSALGIPSIGTSVCERVAKAISRFDRLREIEYADIDGIGEKTVEKVLIWLDLNEDWVLKLPLQLEEDIDWTLESVGNKGKVCITGKADMTKKQLEDILKDHGYKISNSVTKDCDFLIQAGENSTKTKKAEQYGIKIVDYWTNKIDIINGRL